MSRRSSADDFLDARPAASASEPEKEGTFGKGDKDSGSRIPPKNGKKEVSLQRSVFQQRDREKDGASSSHTGEKLSQERTPFVPETPSPAPKATGRLRHQLTVCETPSPTHAGEKSQHAGESFFMRKAAEKKAAALRQQQQQKQAQVRESDLFCFGPTESTRLDGLGSNTAADMRQFLPGHGTLASVGSSSFGHGTLASVDSSSFGDYFDSQQEYSSTGASQIEPRFDGESMLHRLNAVQERITAGKASPRFDGESLLHRLNAAEQRKTAGIASTTPARTPNRLSRHPAGTPPARAATKPPATVASSKTPAAAAATIASEGPGIVGHSTPKPAGTAKPVKTPTAAATIFGHSTPKPAAPTRGLLGGGGGAAKPSPAVAVVTPVISRRATPTVSSPLFLATPTPASGGRHPRTPLLLTSGGGSYSGTSSSTVKRTAVATPTAGSSASVSRFRAVAAASVGTPVGATAVSSGGVNRLKVPATTAGGGGGGNVSAPRTAAAGVRASAAVSSGVFQRSPVDTSMLPTVAKDVVSIEEDDDDADNSPGSRRRKSLTHTGDRHQRTVIEESDNSTPSLIQRMLLS